MGTKGNHLCQTNLTLVQENKAIKYWKTSPLLQGISANQFIGTVCSSG